MQRARTTEFLAAIGVIALVAGAGMYARYGRTTRSAHGTPALGSQVVPSGVTPAAQPGSRSGEHTQARAALQECLKKALLAAKVSWDGMCTALAQRNAEQRAGCRQQGHTAADCLSLYADTMLHECLLPHQTASSIAQAHDTAQSDCYEQFQAQMR